MTRDYYEVLGVPRHADEKQIKSAYRKLARKYHPDVNPNDPSSEAKFKEIGEAYAVLGDEERRRKYDRFGSRFEEAEQYGGGGFQVEEGDFDFGSIFGSIFGGFGGGGEAFTRLRGMEPHDVEHAIEATLEEIDSGTSRTLTYQTQDACPTCQGTGQVTLGDARRRGVCPTCRGTRTVANSRRIQLKIPAGFEDGKKLRVPGGGAKGSNGKSGDLFVAVRVLPHKLFKRKGEDTEVSVDLPFTLAALGGQVRVPTPRSAGHITVPPGTQTGQIFRLRGQGITKLKGGRGDLLARVRITVPEKLTDKQKRLLQDFAKTEETS
ncbi:MAG: J domain-containing protein [Fimbriimonadaceae bacterium]|nr:J domain-containing protein [Fimbriimonadaceae bacterium]QYK55437.1 MAG: J domain-containing protein [Fimbriimonadaceae bacterium]